MGTPRKSSRFTRVFILTFALTLTACSSTPRKNEHALADLLLNKRPRIGVPEVNSHPERPADSAQLMRKENDKERAANQEQDQAEFENKIREFREEFLDLMRERNKALDIYSGDTLVQELERIATDGEDLVMKLSEYSREPGTLSYYLEGQEREFAFRQRNERLRKLESNWRENLANLQGNISEARTQSALKMLGSTDFEPRPSALNSKN